MHTREERIREIARRLLDEKRVDVVIGHRRGTLPVKNAPAFARHSGEAGQFVWDGNCRSNLANFLPRVPDRRAAIIAQGCVSRNIIGMLLEKQVHRDNVYIIGVPCTGMLDRQKVMVSSPGEISDLFETDAQVTIRGRGFEITESRGELIRDNCRHCAHKNPVLFDELAADAVQEQESADRYGEIADLESLSPAERSAALDRLLQPCIRCYACRNACPLCYCPECFVDKCSPQWCGKSGDRRDVLSYHVIRAFHTAGRCTGCGACEDACPMGIRIRLLSGKVEKDVRETFGGYEAWMSLEAEPPLAAFRLDDPQPFVK